MSNLIAFIVYFLAYLFVFLVIAALVVLACIVGVKWRKAKDAKLASSGGSVS